MFISYVFSIASEDSDRWTLSFYINPTFCPLNCFHCHNKTHYLRHPDGYKELSISKCLDIARQHVQYLNCTQVSISGGEPLFPPIRETCTFELLRKIRQEIPTLKLRLETNGCFPSGLKQLIDEGLVNKVLMDIKIPIWNIDKLEDSETLLRYYTILYDREGRQSVDLPLPYIKSKVEWYAKSVRTSFDLLLNNYRNVVEFETRTVDYPLLTTEDKEMIQHMCEKHGILWKLNEFYII